MVNWLKVQGHEVVAWRKLQLQTGAQPVICFPGFVCEIFRPMVGSAYNRLSRPGNNLADKPDGVWTVNISHTELIRTGYDQTMELDPEEM